MAKKKKNRTVNPHQQSKSTSQRSLQSNYNIIKKLLHNAKLDPNLIDVFTKRQREVLTQTGYEMPSFKPEKINTIPRQFLLQFRKELNDFLKDNYWGDEDNKLSYMEIATCGMAFTPLLGALVQSDRYEKGTPQQKAAQLIYDKMVSSNDFAVIFDKALNDFFSFVQNLMRQYSQINFRQYGFWFSWDTVNGGKTRLSIRFTVNECEAKTFLYHGIYRKAFRLLSPPNGKFEPYNVTVPKHWIIPEANEKHYFNIYVQSHVLHRFKERVDFCLPPYKNLLLHYTLTTDLRVEASETQKFLACSVKDENNQSFPIGYFSFFLQGNDLVLKTFLPMASATTPKGEKLQKIIPLSKEEMIYLGMDKTSFYFMVDFDKIPFLKQALIDADIWESVVALRGFSETEFDENGDPIDNISETKTLFVKHFFDKLEASLISEAYTTGEEESENKEENESEEENAEESK